MRVWWNLMLVACVFNMKCLLRSVDIASVNHINVESGLSTVVKKHTLVIFLVALLTKACSLWG